mmetsp:Transcript_1883/g.4632  ORF Transcript_1883/g.4632 Transcript_1883/m.4632 type:complete len:332 (+) Transcript_1883:232-1227(+)
MPDKQQAEAPIGFGTRHSSHEETCQDSGGKPRDAVLVAGATGYLGTRVVKALAAERFRVKSLCRPSSNHKHLEEDSTIVFGDVAAQHEGGLVDHLSDVKVVISCLGSSITSGDAEAIDRDGNIWLLNEAKDAGVEHLIVVAVFNGPNMCNRVRIVRLKEEAVNVVTKVARLCGMKYTIVRPTGFFKDMEELFMQTVKTGKFPLISNGSAKVNPISGEDLARRICKCISTPLDWNTSVDVGGPDVFSMRQIGLLACEALKKPPQFQQAPAWVVQVARWILGAFGSVVPIFRKYLDALQFIDYVSTHDNVAVSFGSDHLKEYYEKLASRICGL